MRTRPLIALLSFALTAAGPGPAPREIPWAPGEDEALIIPADSPVQSVRFGKDQIAHFRGRFVVTGTFIYGCDIECEPPLGAKDVNGSIVPDPDLATRLPHWKIHDNDIRIYLYGGDLLAAQVLSRAERAAILTGKVDSERKHVSIVIDRFNATIECDSASYDAHFVSLAKPVQVATAKLDGDYGCGWA